MDQQLLIEVAYASPERYHVLQLSVPVGTSIEAAIDKSGIVELYPEIDLTKQKVGVFSQQRSLTDMVSAGDRIEVYRPLVIDPKAARKERAAKKNQL